MKPRGLCGVGLGMHTFVHMRTLVVCAQLPKLAFLAPFSRIADLYSLFIFRRYVEIFQKGLTRVPELELDRNATCPKGHDEGLRHPASRRAHQSLGPAQLVQDRF